MWLYGVRDLHSERAQLPRASVVPKSGGPKRREAGIGVVLGGLHERSGGGGLDDLLGGLPAADARADRGSGTARSGVEPEHSVRAIFRSEQMKGAQKSSQL